MAEKRRYKKSEITRKKLIDAAVEVFGEKGYSKARITDITKRVGLTHAAFYAYFKDKDDLVRSLIETISGDLGLRGLSPARCPGFRRPRALKKAVSEIFSFYRDNLVLPPPHRGRLAGPGLRASWARSTRTGVLGSQQ